MRSNSNSLTSDLGPTVLLCIVTNSC